MKKFVIAFLLTLTMTVFGASGLAFAEPQDGGDAAKAERTIMLYTCGSDLESKYGMASYNLHQILQANFSTDENVRFIVMTGGSDQWKTNGAKAEDGSTEFDYLCEADGTAIKEVSNEYNQVWEAKGKDAAVNPGKMVLLDGDGITGEDVKSKDELMSNPDTLKAFINYCADKYPAEKYDLILWDHGGGPLQGFAMDEHLKSADGMTKPVFMTYAQIIDAISDNKVTENGGKFDFIDFDACLMSTVELTLALSDYMDYYIASPETEPGYGQPYTEWLDSLGQDPGRSAYDIGKQIVDEFTAFYDKGYADGTRQEGTLAVIDINKLLGETNFLNDLSQMNQILRDQALDSAFYDELASSEGSIQYGEMDYADLGNLASQISIALKERDGEDDKNVYNEVAGDLNKILSREDVIYTKGTKGIRASGLFYRNTDGEVKVTDPDLDTLMKTSGMYIYFPLSFKASSIDYFDEVAEAVKRLPQGDARTTFLKDYICTMMDYTMILKSGHEVGNMLSKGYTKDSISYDSMKEFLNKPYSEEYPDFNPWTAEYETILDRRDGTADGKVNYDEATLAWLKTLVNKQAGDAVAKSNISVSNVKKKNGTGYLVTINDIHKRSIDKVSVDLMAELPIAKEYMNTLDKDMRDYLMDEATSISIGTVDAESQITAADYMDYTSWYNSTSGSWEIDPLEDKTFAIRDAEGTLHACEYSQVGDTFWMGATIPDRNGDGEVELVVLRFQAGKLSSVAFTDTMKEVAPAQFEQPITVTPIHQVSIMGLVEFNIPISKSFTISSKNYQDIAPVYVDISSIPDVGDTTGDDKSIHYKFVVNDIYESKLDFSEKALDPEGQLIDINLARIKPVIYNGEAQTPVVVCEGKTLVEGVDYNLIKMQEDEVYKEKGDYAIMLEGIGSYTGTTPFPFKTFSIVEDEFIARTLVAQAKAEYDAANAAYMEALASEDTDLAALKAAMIKLHNAEAALKEAEDSLKRTLDVLSKEEQAELADQIAQLQEEIETLSGQVAELKVVDITNYAATLSKTSYKYTGKEIKPSVTVSGVSKENYTVTYKNNKKIGTATVIIKATGENYKGQITKTFKITKRTNTLAVKGKTVKVKYSKLKKKTQTLAAAKVFKFTKDLKDKKTYTISSAKKGSKNFKKYFKVHKTTGKLKVKKGLQKGTYKVKIKVKAAGTATYSASKTFTVTVTVKVK